MRRCAVGFVCLTLILVATVAEAQTPKQKADVEALIKLLKTSQDPKQRAAACNEITELASVKIALVKPAVPSLLDSLKDADVEVRRAAINTLSLVEPYAKDWVASVLPRAAEGED